MSEPAKRGLRLNELQGEVMRSRREVIMPGVGAVRLSSPIRSIRYSGSPPLLSPIRCMAALVI